MQDRHVRAESAETSSTRRTANILSNYSSNPIRRASRVSEVSLLNRNATFTTTPAELFYSTVLVAFKPRVDGVFSGDRLPLSPGEGNYSNVAMCIRGLLPLARPAERQALDMALFSLLTMYMGQLNHDSELTEMARSAYTSAIRDFRHAIELSFPMKLASTRLEHYQSFLVLSTTLQLFEVSATLTASDSNFVIAV